MSVPGHFSHDGPLVSRVFIQQTFSSPCYVPGTLLGLGDTEVTPNWEDPGSLWGQRTSRSTAVPITSWDTCYRGTSRVRGQENRGRLLQTRWLGGLSQEETFSSRGHGEIPETVPGEEAAGGEARGEKRVQNQSVPIQTAVGLERVSPPKSLEAPPHRALQAIGHAAENSASEMVLSSRSRLQPWPGLSRHLLTGPTLQFNLFPAPWDCSNTNTVM